MYEQGVPQVPGRVRGPGARLWEHPKQPDRGHALATSGTSSTHNCAGTSGLGGRGRCIRKIKISLNYLANVNKCKIMENSRSDHTRDDIRKLFTNQMSSPDRIADWFNSCGGKQQYILGLEWLFVILVKYFLLFPQQVWYEFSSLTNFSVQSKCPHNTVTTMMDIKMVSCSS